MSDKKNVTKPKQSFGIKLSPQKEREFQKWWKEDHNVQQWLYEFEREYGEKPDPDHSPDYDYRKAWLGGPNEHPIPTEEEDGRWRHHWGSAGKSKKHPTYHKQFQKTAKEKNVFKKISDSEKTSERFYMSDKKSVSEKFRQFLYRNLEEKGLAGTDASFKSPVVTPEEYANIMRQSKKDSKKKEKKKTNPFKDAVKAEGERRDAEKWESLQKYVDKNYDIDKANKILDDYSLYIQKRDKTEKKYGKLTDL